LFVVGWLVGWLTKKCGIVGLQFLFLLCLAKIKIVRNYVLDNFLKHSTETHNKNKCDEHKYTESHLLYYLITRI